MKKIEKNYLLTPNISIWRVINLILTIVFWVIFVLFANEIIFAQYNPQFIFDHTEFSLFGIRIIENHFKFIIIIGAIFSITKTFLKLFEGLLGYLAQYLIYIFYWIFIFVPFATISLKINILGITISSNLVLTWFFVVLIIYGTNRFLIDIIPIYLSIRGESVSDEEEIEKSISIDNPQVSFKIKKDITKRTKKYSDFAIKNHDGKSLISDNGEMISVNISEKLKAIPRLNKERSKNSLHYEFD